MPLEVSALKTSLEILIEGGCRMGCFSAGVHYIGLQTRVEQSLVYVDTEWVLTICQLVARRVVRVYDRTGESGRRRQPHSVPQVPTSR